MTCDNTAAVTTSNDGSDSDSASVDVLCADIDVDKTADAGSVVAGDDIGFTVTLTNVGPGEAKGLQFTDALPAGFDWEIAPGRRRLVDRRRQPGLRAGDAGGRHEHRGPRAWPRPGPATAARSTTRRR